MKKMILAVITIIGMSFNSFGYDYTKKQLAPIGYSLNLSSDVKDLIKQQSPDIFATQKAETKFRFIIYYALENEMKAKGVNLFPYQCFGKKGSTDEYGFPKMMMHTAAKTGVSKFYFKIDVDVELAKPVSEGKGEITVKMVLTSFKAPSILPLDKIDTETTTEIVLDSKFLEEFVAQTDEISETSLIAAFNKTSAKLAKIMTQK